MLFVGRLTDEKGPDLAIIAAKAAGLPIRLVGDGPLEAELRSMMPSAMFEGWRTREEIGQLCQKARMLVMPSRWSEPYGMVVGEALWSGLPVVVSDNAFIAGDVLGAQAGLTFDRRNVDTLTKAMKRIANDDQLALTMSQNGFSGSRSIGNTLEDWEALQIDLYGETIDAAFMPGASLAVAL